MRPRWLGWQEVLLESHPSWPEATPVGPGNPWLHPPGILPLSVARVQAWRGSQPREGERSARHVAREGPGAPTATEVPEASGPGFSIPLLQVPLESPWHRHPLRA